MSRFSKPQAAGANTGETIVCLTANDAARTCLYAHPVTLRTWSGTLRNVLEDISSSATTTCTSDGSNYKVIHVPVEYSEVVAWKAALDMMHPPHAANLNSMVTESTAMGLLQLADKYDMPDVTSE
jgi:hypothetical protein